MPKWTHDPYAVPGRKPLEELADEVSKSPPLAERRQQSAIRASLHSVLSGIADDILGAVRAHRTPPNDEAVIRRHATHLPPKAVAAIRGWLPAYRETVGKGESGEESWKELALQLSSDLVDESWDPPEREDIADLAAKVPRY